MRMVVLLIAATLFVSALTAGVATAENIVFPSDAGVLDVTKEPYNAKGDGKTDDTEALRKAYEHTGLIYIPNGTYLISDSIVAPPRRGSAPCRRILQGQSAEKTIIRLKDKSDGFGDASKPKPLLKVSWGVAQAFRNGVRNMTFDCGNGNPGAIGLEFFASNQGGMHHVHIRSGDGAGAIGLKLAGDNGPMLINDVRVTGYDVGVLAAANQSVVMEHFRLKGQRTVGMKVTNKTIVRDLVSENTVPAVQAAGQEFVLLDSALRGGGGTAVEAGGMTFIRNLEVSGYGSAISGKGNDVKGPRVEEWASAEPICQFPSPRRSLNLPVKETPDVPWGEMSDWVSVRSFPIKPVEITAASGKKRMVDDCTEAFQRAIDSGKGTVYFPPGKYNICGTVHVRGNVRRIIGLESEVPAPFGPGGKIVFEDGAAPVVVFERFDLIYSKLAIEIATRRTVVLSSIVADDVVCLPGSGDLFLEDVCGWKLDINKNHVWARQLNQEDSYAEGEENPRPNTFNNGGVFWLLGLKTEQNRTKVWTRNGGMTEVFAYILANRSANPLPMFVAENSAFSLTVAESVGRNAPFEVIVRETRGGETKDLKGGRSGCSVPLYVGYTESLKVPCQPSTTATEMRRPGVAFPMSK